ncbi:MAG: aspartate/glutamate racemase family protein [Vulcanibacillus sp.]
MSKIIGILGGMGPLATIDLFQKIVINTPASTDQEHLQILIYNNPKVPPRTTCLDISVDNPLIELRKSAILLENAGADFVIMPCHTAHIWYEEIKKSINIPFYSMIENTVQEIIIQNKYSNRQIFLLATETTIQNKLYQNAFGSSSKLIIPNQEEQRVVSNLIKSIKSLTVDSNQYIEELNTILFDYKKKGITAILGGCTEIPLVFPYLSNCMEKIDPTLMLALMAISKAKIN